MATSHLTSDDGCGGAGNEDKAAAGPLAQFEAAVQVVDSLPRGSAGQAAALQGFKPSTELMLRFYALYKQAKFGPCQRPRPAFWDLVGKVKWDAWRALGDMPRERAMLEYSRQLRRVIENLPSSPQVSGLIDKVGSFYRLVDVVDAAAAAAAASDNGGGILSGSDIKRGLMLANRIRWRSGGSGSGVGVDEDEQLDVNSNFLTQSMPPLPASSAKAFRAANGCVGGDRADDGIDRRAEDDGGNDGYGRGGNAVVSRSQPDLRRQSLDWNGAAAAAAAAAAVPAVASTPNDNDSDASDDLFCDSFDNFVQLDDNEDDHDRDDHDSESGPPPAGDVTGGGGGSSDNRQAGRRQQQQQQQPPPPPPPLANRHRENGDESAAGSLPWQQRQRQAGGSGGGRRGLPPDDRDAAGGPEQQLLGELRHIRAALDRLSDDLGRVHVRLDGLDRRRPPQPLPAPPPRPLATRLWPPSSVLGGGGGGSAGGLSLKALLVILAWPVAVQLLWRVRWCALLRRLLRLRSRRGGRPIVGR